MIYCANALFYHNITCFDDVSRQIPKMEFLHQSVLVGLEVEGFNLDSITSDTIIT